MKYIFSFSLILALTITLIGSSTNYKHTESVSSNSNKNLSTHKKLFQIIDEKRTLSEFKSVSIFNFSRNASENDNSASFVNSASLMNISKRNLEKALNSKDENILFSIPVLRNEDLELELTLSFPASDDFILTAKDGISEKRVSYTPGLHYNGIIKGKNNSIASLSIYKNFVMGIISDETGNYVLGAVKNSDNSFSEKYIFYNDANLKVKDSYKCGVEDYEEKFTMAIEESKNNFSTNANSDNPARLPVKIYFEADYQFYLDQGNSTVNVANFINGMFNAVKTIYQNEGIPFEVSRIGVWTAPDPYRNLNDSYLILLKFGEANKDDFQGNLALFLSTRNAGLGGIAWIRVMCTEYSARDSSGRFAYSNIEPNYNNFPTYSWTVNVVTHEMGHSMGSRHTHACWWPTPGGAIRAIDSCFTNENCSFPTRPRVGTIMSYCHLYPASQGGGINLASGFGQLPGDTIRLRYSQAGCLDRVLNSSERPSSFQLAQNFPNPYNPSTIIRFALPNETNVSLKVYDVNGRLVADLLQNKFYSPGFYDYEFNSSLYGLSSGIYFYRIVAGGFAESKRMVLIK